MPGVAFPPVGPVGLSSPPSSVLCSAKTATLPVSGHFACRSRPDTLPASVRSWCPSGARGLVEAPRLRQGLWSPGPPIRAYNKETEWLSHVPELPLMNACPALRPRWGPLRSPKRVWDCCLPVPGNRRLSHHWYTFSGLNHAACILAPSSSVLPLLGVHVEVAPDLLARLLSGGTCTEECSPHWVTTTNFIGLLLLPRFRAYLGATRPWFGWC